MSFMATSALRQRLAVRWTLTSLAEEVHLSRSQLVRAFDATVGMSPMAYLRHTRVERMARLLASTDLSIAEAARAVGWTDPDYASRCSDDAVTLETRLHQKLAGSRVNYVNMRREFFMVTPAEIHDILIELGESIITWTDEAEALEWRQSETTRRELYPLAAT